LYLFFAQSLIGIESSTACRLCAYYFGIDIDFTVIYIDCAAWPGLAMSNGRLPASLLGHSAYTSTSSVRHHHHRLGCLRRLLPLSLHLARTPSVQLIMRDPPALVMSIAEFYAHLL
jgi:hypothetical protein